MKYAFFYRYIVLIVLIFLDFISWKKDMNRKIFTMIHLLGEHYDFTRTVVRLVDNTRQNVEYSH